MMAAHHSSRPDKSQPTPIAWTCDPYSKEGVGQTNRHCSRVASGGFGGCIGLIVQNPANDHAYGFHFFRGVVTEGQLKALQKIAKSGEPYHACFIRSSAGFHPDKPINYCTIDIDEHCSLQEIIDRTAPNLQWHPSVEAPHLGWGFDYDAKARALTLTSEGQTHAVIENPLDLEPMKWVERTMMGPGESMARGK